MEYALPTANTKDMADGNYANITATIRKSIDVLLSFELAHIGINMDDREASLGLAGELSDAFGFSVREGNSSNFAETFFEIMNTRFSGKNGHIALRTNSINRAVYYLAKRGFAVHLLQK